MNELVEYVNRHEEIFVYGVGINSKLLNSKLKEENIIINGYVVSDNVDCTNENVYTLSQWIKNKENKNWGILIAVFSNVRGEILEILKEYGINDFYIVKPSMFWVDQIGLMDTTVSDYNHGNQIIMDSVRKYINDIIKNKFVMDLPCWDDLEGHALEAVSYCEYLFLGGTNLLSGDIENKKYIGINDSNLSQFENKVILMGVGWNDSDVEITPKTVEIYRKILKRDVLHSVRNKYTKEILEKIGITNVLNTGCPTLWSFTEEFCKKIPTQKAENALIMVSSWDFNRDNYIAQIIKNNYRKIYAWVQQPSDYTYIKLLYPEAEIIGLSLEDLDVFLEKCKDVDYIGSRLHGGIRCLQKCKRCFIIPIDYRAVEMKKDFNLPVVDNIYELEKYIISQYSTDIRMPFKEIEMWKKQFN